MPMEIFGKNYIEIFILTTFNKSYRNVRQTHDKFYFDFKDAMPVSFRSELFTAYILTIFKQ